MVVALVERVLRLFLEAPKQAITSRRLEAISGRFGRLLVLVASSRYFVIVLIFFLCIIELSSFLRGCGGLEEDCAAWNFLNNKNNTQENFYIRAGQN